MFFDIEKLYQQQLQENRDILAPVKSFADLEKNQQSGKLSSLLTIEDAGLLEGKPERLQILYDRGVRLMTLLWNYENCIGFPQSRDEVEHRKGLKPFGVEVVERMNDIGMIVDVSHLSRDERLRGFSNLNRKFGEGIFNGNDRKNLFQKC